MDNSNIAAEQVQPKRTWYPNWVHDKAVKVQPPLYHLMNSQWAWVKLADLAEILHVSTAYLLERYHDAGKAAMSHEHWDRRTWLLAQPLRERNQYRIMALQEGYPESRDSGPILMDEVMVPAGWWRKTFSANSTTDTPLYVHDCDNCCYLGRFTAPGRSADLWFCTQEALGPTVIARDSSEGSDYESGMVFVGKLPALTEAHRRAVECGLIGVQTDGKHGERGREPIDGEMIYVSTNDYIVGGLATISSWQWDVSGGEKVPFVRFKGLNGSFNFWDLLKQQDTLRKQFGTSRAARCYG